MTRLPNCQACNKPLDVHSGIQYGWCILDEEFVGKLWEVLPTHIYHPRCAPEDHSRTYHEIQGKEDRAA